MNDQTNHVAEGVAATGATVAAGGVAMVTAEHWLHILVSLATLAWWLRLWLRNPNQKPPEA